MENNIDYQWLADQTYKLYRERYFKKIAWMKKKEEEPKKDDETRDAWHTSREGVWM